MICENNKYKDENPRMTINKIRNILSDIGIVTIESFWKNSAKGYYSVNISIPNTSINCNGKGTSRIFALASGYGELMERLQNLAPFRLSMELTKETNEYLSFIFAPDEKNISLDEFLNSKEDWISTEKERLGTKYNNIMNKWKSICSVIDNGDFITIPYINIKTGNLSYIPVQILNKLYKTNGMCAGNSFEEALIQGICEILERYVNRKILEGNITPPTIPYEYLKNYPTVATMIETIEFSGNYSIVVKDCSLGEGYPVVSVIFIDKNTQKYFVKFGSFPKFQIALERTLTELLQGKDIENMEGLQEFDYNAKIENNRTNIIDIFANGQGRYPKELFLDKPTYEFKNYSRFEGKTNKEIFRGLISFVEEKGYNVYVRDVSFLGFPSYHVIIPNLSEIDNIEDTDAIESYHNYNRVCKAIYDLNSLNEDEINNLIDLLEQNRYHPLTPVTKILNIEINFPLPWYFSNITFLILVLNCKIKNYKKSSEILRKYLKIMRENFPLQKVPPYYKCVNQYLHMKMDNNQDDQIILLLKKFYNEEMIQKVIEQFDPDIILNEEMLILRCYECQKCLARNYCDNVKKEKIYRILKEKYQNNKINQSDLISKLNN